MGNIFTVNIELGSLIPFCCTPPSGEPVRKNINDLQNHLVHLVAKKDDLNRQIHNSPAMKPLLQVTVWLEEAEKLEANAQKLINDYTQASTITCFWGICPKNCRKRYDLWRKIPPMYKDVTDLEQRLPTVFFEEAPIASPQIIPMEPPTGRESMLDEVWRHIQDEQEAGMIGLYGMGGVGKTTLLKALNNKLCRSAKSFDPQLWIVVSKTPNLVNIQNDIGKKIGLRDAEWISKSLDEKARDIFNILEKKKYILFLDDIWERFDLLKIGVPLPDLTNKSKVIFTTRLKQVCGQMKANNHIPVKCLNEAEARALFKENVGEDALNSLRDVPDLVEDVMKECGGLPLALIVIGRAMACKTTIDEWKHAIDALKENAAKLSANIHDEVFGRLKYSYDNLSDDSIRFCFLYCSLYPEDNEIPKRELRDKWLCEDVLDQSNDLDKVRRQGNVNISTLVKASLLEECSNGCVKMHDVIRDMAIWIGGDCGEKQNKFIVKAQAGLTLANWEHVERLSLMYNNIEHLNVVPKWPNLLTLFLNSANLKSINNGFFEFMPKLQVLDLSGNDTLSSLPNDIGKLVSLQYLNVTYTAVAKLPKELKELRKLKYLDMENTRISSIPEEVVSSLMELRVLKCEDIFTYGGSYTARELERLEYLNDVTTEITTEIGISNLSSCINLGVCITALTIGKLDGIIHLDLVFLEKVKNLGKLILFDLATTEKIMVGKHGMTINSLCYLILNDCPQLEDISWSEFAPNIKEISVEGCEKMKTLVGNPRQNDNARAGGRPYTPFAKLTSLEVERLPNLESISPTNLLLPSLKKLRVRYCDKLEKLHIQYVAGIEKIEGEQSWWNKLEWEDDITQIAFSKCFHDISDEPPVDLSLLSSLLFG